MGFHTGMRILIWYHYWDELTGGKIGSYCYEKLCCNPVKRYKETRGNRDECVPELKSYWCHVNEKHPLKSRPKSSSSQGCLITSAETQEQ